MTNETLMIIVRMLPVILKNCDNNNMKGIENIFLFNNNKITNIIKFAWMYIFPEIVVGIK